MATKLLTLRPETPLSHGIGVWELRSKLLLAECNEEGEALVADALVLTRAEQVALLGLLIDRRNAGLLQPDSV